MKKTNFDAYLEVQMKDPAFAERFRQAGAAWDVALRLAALRKKAGLSQKDLRDDSKPRSSRSADWSRPVTKATP